MHVALGVLRVGTVEEYTVAETKELARLRVVDLVCQVVQELRCDFLHDLLLTRITRGLNDSHVFAARWAAFDVVNR